MTETAVDILDFQYHYPDGTCALAGVNLRIHHGEKVALIGPNGAGKSTLLLAMAGFVKGIGRILVDGITVQHENLRQIRKRLGCCLENPDDQLFMPTLRDDVAFGPRNMGLSPEQVDQCVSSALSTVGLEGMADKAPHHLSAGQKRAAAIATVIAMSPEIITFDEPDGSLDPRRRRELVALLNGLSQTLIIATCNMDFAYAVAGRAVIIDQGRIQADGTVEHIMHNTALMERHGLEVPRS